jgi:fructokinase
MDSIFELAEGEKVEEVGIGSFGPLCLSGENLGTITSTPKKEWIDFPLLKEVKRRSSMEVVRFGIDTDVNCGAMGEHRLGGYSSEESLAYITVGTGVGVGLVVKG